MFCTYQITCIGNNKKYYGSAHSFNDRKSKHLHYLRNNNHINKHLQNAFNKYGEDSFLFQIIAEFESRELMLEAEQELIDTYYGVSFNKSKSSYGPQLFGEDNGFFGKTHIEETKIKMRNAKLGKLSNQAVLIITDKGIYSSITLACQYHGIEKSTYYRRLKKGKTDWITV